MKWWYRKPIEKAMLKYKTKEKAAKHLDISLRTLRNYCKEIWLTDKSFKYYDPKYDGTKGR